MTETHTTELQTTELNMTEIKIADFSNPVHASAVVYLLNEYAKDPMGGGEALSAHTQANLVAEMAKRPTVFAILAFVDGKPAGLANCVEGFSTFASKPLINIHDVVVLVEFRGRGISSLLLHKAEEIAVSKGCCKLTLEVLEGNKTAQTAYVANGFAGYQLDPEMGSAMFWQKKL
jgi:GNAT superfamily N-acetyltransferase